MLFVLPTAEEKLLRLVEGSGMNADCTGIGLQPDEGMAGQVFQTARPVVVSNYTHWKGHRTIISFPAAD